VESGILQVTIGSIHQPVNVNNFWCSRGATRLWLSSRPLRRRLARAWLGPILGTRPYRGNGAARREFLADGRAIEALADERWEPVRGRSRKSAARASRYAELR
jgi:hypothetical protein